MLDLNNPGNIEHGDPWQGLAEDQPHPRFAKFSAPVWGLRAIARTLITYYDNRQAADGSKIDTVREIVERWAPASDGNPVNQYTYYLTQCLERAHFANGTNPYILKDEIDIYDPVTLRALMKGITMFENGKDPYSDHDYDNALLLAGVVREKKPASKDATTVTVSAAAATSAAAMVLEVGSPALTSIKEILPYATGLGSILAVATVAFTVLAVYVRLRERKQSL